MKAFTSDLFPNTHICFTPEGVMLWVSLCIEPRMIRHLSPNNVFKGKQRTVYALRRLVENPNQFSMQKTYETLMNRAMIHCREAKIKAYEKEIEQLKITFNN